MAKNISLILHRFKDVRTFKDTGAQMYLDTRELSELLVKLGKTHEEAAKILEKVIPTPSHYRLQLSLNDQQEEQARRVFTESW